MFRITITESTIAQQDGAKENMIERYTQSVDVIDLPKIIAAVNSKPRKAREPKAPVAKKGDAK